MNQPEATSSDLPDGWADCPLPHVAQLIMGQSPPGSTYNDDGEGLPFFQGKTDFRSRYPVVRKWCSAPTKIAERGDVLMSIRAPVGPTNVADQRCAIGRGLAAIRPTSATVTEFLLFALRLQEQSLAEQGTGSTFTAINRNRLDSVAIALAPLAEQKRIVAKVEELLARVNAARERLDKAPVLLKRFRQSVLYAAFSGLLTEDWRGRSTGAEVGPAFERLVLQRHQEYEALCRKAAQKGQRRPKPPTYLGEAKDEAGDLPNLPELPDVWTWRTVRDAASAMQYGTSVRADAPADIGIPMLRMSNVQDGRIDYADLKYMAKDGDDWQDFLLREGDIVFNRTNSPELVGKAAVFSGARKVVFASYLVRLACDTRAAIPAFVCYWINSPWGRAWARAVRTDGVSQSNINATKLATMPLPLPTIEEQLAILRRIEALFARADKIEARVQAAMARVEKITQAILAKAFRGELVPTEAELARQDPRIAATYEPASALLERIHAHRADPAAAKPKRRPMTQRGHRHG